MKKKFALLTITAIIHFGVTNNVLAQDDPTATTTEEVKNESTVEEAPTTPIVEQETKVVADENASLHQVIKEKFIAGGPLFMAPILICLILGLAICIERIIYLNMATTNTKKLLGDIESALSSGGVELAKDVCRNTKGPVASIFYQGLDRAKQGIEIVEKSVIAYGSVQMGLLEKGLSWISLFISLSPMLGFFGTVVGMIMAFDQIAAANNISPAIVAGGIGVALLTTLAGLLVAIILQIFYNYIVAKIDGLVSDMEDSSIALVDVLINQNLFQNK